MDTSTSYSSKDLIWTKNVKHDGGNGWAYMEYHTGDLFCLNWPRGRADMGRTDAKKVKRGELILLFQSVSKNSGYKPGTYLTHIVSPVEDNIRPDVSGTHPFNRLVVVVAKCKEPIVKPQMLDFREPNRGWACSLDKIKPFVYSGLSLSMIDKQKLFWDLFEDKEARLKSIIGTIYAISVNVEDGEILEGEELFKMGIHKFYERNSKIVSEKKRIALQSGKMSCEICGFDYAYHYGRHGEGFMECHHITPIAGNGKRPTKLSDLALVCANCHRMLHRKNMQDSYHSMADLLSIYKK